MVSKFIKKSFCMLMVTVLSASTLLTSCDSSSDSNSDASGSGKAKYVFVFIGDGMSAIQINTAEVYKASIAAQADASYINSSTGQLNMTKSFSSTGFATTYDAGTYCTDSASAGTALSTGYKTLSGVINYDVTKTVKYTTIAEMAKAKGMKVGIVSSVSLDHATPAAYYAQEKSRGNYYNIATQLVESGFDYFGGGGFIKPDNSGANTSVLTLATQAGYTIADTKEEFDALTSSNKAIAINAVLDSSNAIPYDLIRDTSNTNDISLADYTKKGIELMKDNSQGFFMMVEGGKVDWACHANDAKAAIQDVIAFDDAIGVALDFYNEHPTETLIIVTGDHETGGLTIGYSGTKYSTAFKVLESQTYSYDKFDSTYLTPDVFSTFSSISDMYDEILGAFGLDLNVVNATSTDVAGSGVSAYQLSLINDAFDAQKNGRPADTTTDEYYVLYGGYKPLSVTITHVLNQRAGIGWTSYSHTGVPVPVFAKGVDEENFNGYYDNTDVCKKIAAAMGFTWPFVIQ